MKIREQEWASHCIKRMAKAQPMAQRAAEGFQRMAEAVGRMGDALRKMQKERGMTP
jgi:hypothetical protein